MTSVVKSTPFEADFAQCALYLSEANPSAALHFVDAVERAIGLVASFPDLGPVWRYGPRKHSTRFLLVPGFPQLPHILPPRGRRDPPGPAPSWSAGFVRPAGGLKGRTTGGGGRRTGEKQKAEMGTNSQHRTGNGEGAWCGE